MYFIQLGCRRYAGQFIARSKSITIRKNGQPALHDVAGTGMQKCGTGKFRRLMLKVEAIRLRYGMKKAESATESGAKVDGVRAWVTGRTVGRKQSVAKIIDFLNRKSVSL
jgi:hypothetical protein